MLPVNAGERLKQLRVALGLTQDGLAERSQQSDPDARLTRVDVVSVETQRNKATSNRIRRGIAAAVGASLEDASAYLDGDLDLPDLMERIERRRTQSGLRPIEGPRRFRDRDEWSRLVAEARQLYRTVPERFFEEAGSFVDHMPGAIDAMFVGDFARMLHELSARTGNT